MRMWNVDPSIMCRSHLLGEHREMHTLLGSLRKGISLRGYITNGLVEVHNVIKRHDALVEEMLKRGYNHKSPIKDDEYSLLYEAGSVDSENSLKELNKRCPYCRENIKNKKELFNVTYC